MIHTENNPLGEYLLLILFLCTSSLLILWFRINLLTSSILAFTLSISDLRSLHYFAIFVIIFLSNQKFVFEDPTPILAVAVLSWQKSPHIKKYFLGIAVISFFSSDKVQALIVLSFFALYFANILSPANSFRLVSLFAVITSVYNIISSKFPLVPIGWIFYSMPYLIKKMQGKPIVSIVLMCIASTLICIVQPFASTGLRFHHRVHFSSLKRNNFSILNNVDYYPIVAYVDSRFISKPEAMLLYRQLNPEIDFFFTDSNWKEKLESIGFKQIPSTKALPRDAIVATIHGSSLPTASLRFMLRDIQLNYGFKKNIVVTKDGIETILRFDIPTATKTIYTSLFTDLGNDFNADGFLGISVFSPFVYERYNDKQYELLKDTVMDSVKTANDIIVRELFLPHLREMFDNNPTVPAIRQRNLDAEAYVIWVSGSNHESVKSLVLHSIDALRRFRAVSNVKHYILYTTFDIPYDEYDLGFIEHYKTTCTVSRTGLHEKDIKGAHWLSRLCLFQINKDLPYDLERVITSDYDITFSASPDHLLEYTGTFGIPLANPISFGQGGIWVFSPSASDFEGLIKLKDNPNAPTECYREVNKYLTFHDETLLGCYFRNRGLFYFGMEMDFMLPYTYVSGRKPIHVALFGIHDAGRKKESWTPVKSTQTQAVKFWLDEKEIQWRLK